MSTDLDCDPVGRRVLRIFADIAVAVGAAVAAWQLLESAYPREFDDHIDRCLLGKADARSVESLNVTPPVTSGPSRPRAWSHRCDFAKLLGGAAREAWWPAHRLPVAGPDADGVVVRE